MLAVAVLATACRAGSPVEVLDDPAETPDPSQVQTSSTEPTSTPEPLATPEPVPSPSPTPVPRAVLERPADFVAPPEWRDPLPVDTAIVSGTLANGLRYFVRENDRPGSQAQLRLVVRAGSLNESPDRQGVAHFLEHMMFNGTERFPGNEIVQVLEGFGSGFGPDVNAYTGFEETVYELEVPTRSTETLQLGLDVLHQWATAATLDPDAVAAERGVVREEHRRSVEPLSGRIGEAVREVLFAGTDWLGREPIGDAEVIDSMTQADLRTFYDTWYRPELLAIVAVGDFDVGSIEQRIIDTFDGPPVPDPTEPLEPDRGDGPLPEPVFDVITDREIQNTDIEILWRLADSPVVTPLDVRNRFVVRLARTMLDRRLFEAVQSGDSALLTGDVGGGGLTPTQQFVSLSGRTDSASVADAVAELLTRLERARQHGFTQDEFDQAAQALRSDIDQDLAESGTRQDSDLAAKLVDHALGRGVPVPADIEHGVAIEVLESIGPEDAQRFLFDLIESPPYVLVTGPASVADMLPEPEELAAIHDRVVGSAVALRDAVDDDRTELMAAPDPAEIIDQQDIPDLSATVVTYENGARLALRQTPITENLVVFRAASPGGFFAVDGPEVPLLNRAAELVSGSGFESVDVVSLQRLLSGSIASLSSSIDRASETLSGDASTGDIETLFQLVHLQMTEPQVTDLQIRQFLEFWRPLAEDPASNPPLAADLELWRLRYGDSPWFRLIPTVADLDGLDPERLLAAYRDRFADAGDFVFVVVGDFDPTTVIELGARYLGTLPDSGRRETAIDRDPGLTEANLVATVEAGVGDQGRLRINWESPYPFTLEAAVAAQALEIVVNARLRDLIREELGASYAPNAAVAVLSEPKPWIDTIIEVDSDPERIDEVSTAVRDELARIRAGEIDPQYLSLAVGQLVEDYRFFSNKDWLDLITFHLTHPDRPVGEFRTRTRIAEQLTVDDLVEASQAAFPPSRSVEVRLVPAG